MPCEAVDAAARKVIDDGGYGPGYKYFTHRVGHGMGMDGHEWPYLVKGNTLPLAPGMTFSDEPGIYIRGEFGVRLEDDMVHHRGRRRADDAAEPVARRRRSRRRRADQRPRVERSGARHAIGRLADEPRGDQAIGDVGSEIALSRGD